VFVFLLLGAAVLALLVWAGRGVGRAGNVLRLGAGLGAGLAAVAAVVSGLRGGWMFSVGLLALSAYLSWRARSGAVGQSGVGDARVMGMSGAEARSILGVSDQASRAEIETAYRRLMQMAHPDRGGSAGLAAQLNAARDRLLKG
jgi:hypothetical protein